VACTRRQKVQRRVGPARWEGMRLFAVRLPFASIGPALLFAAACSSGLPCEQTQTCRAPNGKGGAGNANGGTSGSSGTSNGGHGNSASGSSGTGGGSGDTTNGGAPDDGNGGSGNRSSGGSGNRASGGTNASNGGTTGSGASGSGARGGSNAAQAGEGGSVENNPPPTVVTVTPADQTKNVDIDATVSVEFSESLAADTVSADTVQLIWNGMPVDAAVTYSDSTHKVAITPSGPLALLGTYTVAVNHAVTDVDGAGLAADFSSSFQVRDGAWSAVEPFPAGIGNISFATDATGNTLLAGHNSSAGQAKLRDRGGTWSDAVTISTDPYADGYVAALDDAGDGGVGYQLYDEAAGYASLWVKPYTAGAWGDAELALDPGSEAEMLSFFVSPTGERHALASIKNTLLARHAAPGGAWEDAGTGLLNNSSAVVFSAAWLPNGDGFVTWMGRVINSSTVTYDIRFMRYSQKSGTWTKPASVPGTTRTDLEYGWPGVALDPDGNAMIVWTTDYPTGSCPVNAVRVSAKNEFGDIDAIDGLGIGSLFGMPQVVYDGEDFVTAWIEPVAHNSTSFRLYTNRYHAGSWGDAELHPDGADSSAAFGLYAYGTGNLMLVWGASFPTPADSRLVYSRYAGGSWSSKQEVASNGWDQTLIQSASSSGRATVAANYGFVFYQ